MKNGDHPYDFGDALESLLEQEVPFRFSSYEELMEAAHYLIGAAYATVLHAHNNDKSATLDFFSDCVNKFASSDLL